MQEGQVGGADERDLSPPGDRGQPGGDPLDRAQALARIVHDLDLRGQFRQHLTRRPDHDDRPVRYPRDDAGRPPQQGRAVPFQGGLGRPHPRRPPAS
jgi:hypothetical protein